MKPINLNDDWPLGTHPHFPPSKTPIGTLVNYNNTIYVWMEVDGVETWVDLGHKTMQSLIDYVASDEYKRKLEK